MEWMPKVIQTNPRPDRRELPFEFSGKRIHLIGIGGCGMSGAASVLMKLGAVVSGSDQAESPILQELSAGGATVCIGHDHLNVPHDVHLVVTSAAIPADNPELLAARVRGTQMLKYATLLGEIMHCTTGVAIAGTHGKSTTTALTAFVAREAGLDPSFIIGAGVPQLGGGSGVGSGDAFIVEACEYDRSFLHLAPTHGAILNIEEDHLDYFEDLEEIEAAFADFAALVPSHGTVLFNRDDPISHRAVQQATGRVESFGFDARATWRATRVDLESGLPSFDIEWCGQSIGRTTLAMPGRHNIYNALAACALTHTLGGDLSVILEALGRFQGVERRLMYRGRYRGIDILDDYAHHPTEITASLEAVRQRYQPDRLRVVFQPHQVSRTRFFLEDFADSFELADEVIVPDIYFVRDSESDRQLISGNDLAERITRRGGLARYVPNLDDIAEYLAADARGGDLVITMGAGDVWKVADEMVSRLGADC